MEQPPIDPTDPGPQAEPGDTVPIPWETPVSLEVVPDPPPFPTDALPDWVREMVEAVAEMHQTPYELPALLALTVAATGCGGRVAVHPKGIEGGWAEPTNLYTVTALPPGSMKTPVFAKLRPPIDLVEAELQEAAAPQLDRLRVERATLEKSIARHRELAAKTDDLDQRAVEMDHAARESRELRELPFPAKPRLTTRNATPEELARLLSAHGGRLAVLHDEGGVFDIMLGRYNQQTDLDPWLAGFSGGPVGSDRKGKDGKGENIDVKAAFVTMGMTTQPSVLSELGASGRLRGRGVTARFLYAVPKTNHGRRDLVTAAPVPPAVKARYEYQMAAMLRRLIGEFGSVPGQVDLTLSPGGFDRFAEFMHACERAIAPKGRLRWLPEWGSKLAGQCARIAGLLHMLEHWDGDGGTVISEETVVAAIRICRCLIEHARAAHDLLGESEAMGDARTVFAWLEDQAPIRTFTAREANRGNRGMNAERVHAALAALETAGWVHFVVDDAGTSGRQSARYLTHPRLHTKAAEVDDFEGLG